MPVVLVFLLKECLGIDGGALTSQLFCSSPYHESHLDPGPYVQAPHLILK